MRYVLRCIAMMNKFSYCTLIYDGAELPIAIEHVSRAGYDGIELYPKDWTWAFRELGAQRLKRLLSDASIQVSAVFGGVLGPDPATLLDAAQAADRLGARTVFAVSPVKGEVGRSECEDILNCACDQIEKYSLKLAIHNHAGTFMESLDVSVDLCKAIRKDNFGLCLDSLHFALFDDAIEKKIDPLLPYIAYVHLKDILRSRHELNRLVPQEEWKWGTLSFLEQTYTDLESGIIDNNAIARKISQYGYIGWWLPEIERQRIDRYAHAVNNYNVIRSYIE